TLPRALTARIQASSGFTGAPLPLALRRGSVSRPSPQFQRNALRHHASPRFLPESSTAPLFGDRRRVSGFTLDFSDRATLAGRSDRPSGIPLPILPACNKL
ncbi:MAG: hypothetical protein ACREUU_19540, partial [Gammaproteobacteria bacterium]